MSGLTMPMTWAQQRLRELAEVNSLSPSDLTDLQIIANTLQAPITLTGWNLTTFQRTERIIAPR